MSSANWADLIQAASDAGFTVLDNGTYDVVVDRAEAKKTSTGKDQIAVRFVVETGPNAKATVFNNFVISPENPVALGFFFRHMRALGLPTDWFSTVPAPSMAQVAAAVVGKRCQIVVSKRIWNDEERNQVDAVKPPVGGNAPSSPITGTGPTPQAVPQPGASAYPQPAPQPVPQAAPAPVAAPQPMVKAPALTPVQQVDPIASPVDDGGADDIIAPPEVPF